MRHRDAVIMGVGIGVVFASFSFWRGSVLQGLKYSDQAFLQEASAPAFPPEVRVPEPNLASLGWGRAFSVIPWEARDSHVFAVFHGALWLMGGLDGNGFVTKDMIGEHVRYGDTPYFDDIWTSKNGLTWEKVLEHTPWGKRRSIQAVEFKGKLWVMGGWGPEVGYKNDVWASEDGVHWERATASAAWPAREGHSLLVWRDKIWLVGGVRYGDRTFNDVWSSTDGYHWELMTNNASWSSRWDHAVAAYKDKLWLTAGMNLKGGVFKDVWESDDGTDWKLVTKNPPWAVRQGHTLLDYKGKLWTIGILNDAEVGGPNDIWFTEDGLHWTKTDEDPPWLGREDHGAVVFHGRMWVTGGMDRNWHWNNEVWYSSFTR